MTKRDFFIIVLKLTGLFLFFSIITSLVSFIYGLFESGGAGGFYIVLFLLFFLAVFSYFFLFNPKLIIDLLKLDKGFDTDRFEWGGLTKIDFAEVSVFILGIYIFVQSIPAFLIQFFLLFKTKVSPKTELLDNLDNFTSPFSGVNYYSLTIYIMNFIIGYLIMTNYDLIVQKIFRLKEK